MALHKRGSGAQSWSPCLVRRSRHANNFATAIGVILRYCLAASRKARLRMKTVRLLCLLAALYSIVVAVSAQSNGITVVLTGQSMLRSDLRATKPAAVNVVKGMLNGDVIFTNLEAAVAMPGETIKEGRGFLTPPEALDALTAMGFNLVALSGNHAFDLKEAGIRNTLREIDRRKIVHAGTGNNLAEEIGRAHV